MPSVLKLEWFIALGLLCASAAFAQQNFQLGPPVAPVAQSPENLLALSSAQPPAELAAGAEVVLVSGYRPEGNSGARVNVEIKRPGAKVLLLLTSYEKVSWRVTAAPGTTISAIIAGGYYPSTVETGIKTQGYTAKLPYAAETDNLNFVKLLEILNRWFGINKVDIFRGAHAIPTYVSIEAVDPAQAGLTATGTLPTPPARNFSFEVLREDYKKARWTLTGPESGEPYGYIDVPKIAVSKWNVVYKMRGDNLTIQDDSLEARAAPPLPPNFPSFSHAMDIAYDSKRDIVCVVSLGGEGFLYRFDARNNKWLDYRSLNNIDIKSLTYDETKDRYIAWTDDADLIGISGEGHALFKIRLTGLPGLGRLYDRGNSRPPRLTLAARGDDIALLFIEGHIVRNVWHYDLRTGKAVLSYKNSMFASPGPER